MSDEPNDDLRKYLPGRDRARELSDANAAQERIARALEEAARAAEEDGANDSVPAGPVAPGHARGASFRGPKPPAPAPAPVPVEVPRRTVERSRKPRWTTTLVSLLGVLAVLLPVTLAIFLLARPTPPDRDPGASVLAGPQGPQGRPATMTATAMPLPATTEAPSTASAPMIDATSVPGVRAAPSADASATGAAPNDAPPAASTTPGASVSVKAPPKPVAPAGPHGNAEPASSAPRAHPGTAPTASPSTSPAAPPEPTGAAPRYTDPDF